MEGGRLDDLWSLARLAANEGILTHTSNWLAVVVTAERRITPAEEWLLDNSYLVEEQICAARRHLAKGYSRESSVLANVVDRRLPRVYDIALETIAHGDRRVDS